jgi:hypothetical protein
VLKKHGTLVRPCHSSVLEVSNNILRTEAPAKFASEFTASCNQPDRSVAAFCTFYLQCRA